MGFESFRPTLAPGRRYGPKAKVSKRRIALFYGYLFVNLREADIPRALSASLNGTPALRRVFCEPGFVSVIPAAEVEALRETWAEGGFDDYAVPFEAGDRVSVRGGPFDHFPAIIERVLGARAKVMVEIFGRLAPAECDVSQLRRAD